MLRLDWSQRLVMSGAREVLDFDEEGRALWARLNLDGAAGRTRGHWNALD